MGLDLIYATPFLLIAAVSFTFLSLIPKGRPFAIVVPSMMIALGPGLLIGLLVVDIFIWKLGWGGSANHAWGVLFVIASAAACGLLAVIVVGLVIHKIVRKGPVFLGKSILLIGAFCSYFLLAFAICIVVSGFLNPAHLNESFLSAYDITIFGIAAVIGISGTLWILQRSSEFIRLNTSRKDFLGEEHSANA